jgi:homocysteine S-methyltransferase
MPHPTTGPLVLDGGLATELAARGYDLSDALWSARLLADAPEAIEAVHRAYFEAGANVAITASYQASFEG